MLRLKYLTALWMMILGHKIYRHMLHIKGQNQTTRAIVGRYLRIWSLGVVEERNDTMRGVLLENCAMMLTRESYSLQKLEV